jgi:hypothetical protein
MFAGIAAWLPVMFMFETGSNSVLPRFYTLRFLPVAIAGSFGIGFPVALLTFLFSWRHLAQSSATLAIVAVLAGIMMILTSYAIADEEGVFLLGIPAFVAALTYGILGWFWILKPLQRTLNSPPQEKEIA